MPLTGTHPSEFPVAFGGGEDKSGGSLLGLHKKPLTNFMVMDGSLTAGLSKIPAFGTPEQYITVFNSSPNTIYVSPSGSDTLDLLKLIDIVYPYMVRTIPIFDVGGSVNLFWTGLAGTTDRIMVVTSVENLGFNVSVTQTSFGIGSLQYLATVESGMGPGSLYGNMNVGVAATKICVGATSLAGRVSVVIQVIGATDVFIGTDNLVTLANGLKIPTAGEREYRLNPRNPVDLFGISSAASEIRLVEVLP